MLSETTGRKPWFDKLIFFGLAALAAGMGFSIAATSIALGVCLALAMADRATRPVIGWYRTPLDEPVAILVIVTLLSALFGLNPGKSFTEFWGSWVFLIYYFCLWYARTEKRFRVLAVLLCAVGGLTAIYSVIQHYTGWNPMGKPLPTTSNFAGDAARYLSKGTFSHHQTFANVSFMIFCLAFSLTLTTLPRRWRPALAAVTSLLALAVVFSYTRGIWLATLVAVLTIAIFRGKKAFLVFIIVLAVLGAALMIVPSSYSTRARTIFTLRGNIDRLIIWESSWGMLRDYPLLGIGVGNFKDTQEEYLPPNTNVRISRAHAHNSYLQLAIERGLFASMAFAWMWYVILRLGFSSLWFLRGREGFRLAAIRGATAGVVGFLIDGFFQNNFGDAEVVALLLFLVSLIIGLRVKQAEREAAIPAIGGAHATA